MTHPDALAALAALRSARQAWPWLADLVAAGPTDRRRGGHITPAAAARRDQLLREERADLVGQQRSGLRPVGASPVPIDLDVVDAQEAALALAVDEAWRVSSTLRRRRTFVAGAAGTLGPGLVYGQPWIEAYGTTWEATTRYLLVALNHVTPPIAGHVARAASVIDREIRRAAGVGPAWRVVYAACPACDLRMVRAEVSDPDPAVWVVRCDNRECTCRGIACACKQPDRAQHYGQRHWWLGRDWASWFGPLAGVIREMI